jgi:hypothetical protein
MKWLFCTPVFSENANMDATVAPATTPETTSAKAIVLPRANNPPLDYIAGQEVPKIGTTLRQPSHTEKPDPVGEASKRLTHAPRADQPYHDGSILCRSYLKLGGSALLTEELSKTYAADARAAFGLPG